MRPDKKFLFYFYVSATISLLRTAHNCWQDKRANARFELTDYFKHFSKQNRFKQLHTQREKRNELSFSGSIEIHARHTATLLYLESFCILCACVLIITFKIQMYTSHSTEIQWLRWQRNNQTAHTTNDHQAMGKQC